jgi:NAD(P)-dependent dehydrogenase (short-subunit alcohol dehydrogenase family)
MSEMRTRGTQDQQTSTDDRHGSGRMSGKVAIITGGDSGVGRATAVRLAREGASVTIVYLPGQQNDAEITAALVSEEGQRCQLCPGDVNEPAFCDKVVTDTLDYYGRLDILVNNAACQDHPKDIPGIYDEQSDRRFRTNMHGYLHMTRAAVPHMGKGGAIINVGSSTEPDGRQQSLDSSASRGAIHAFTRSLAQNLVSEGIRVTDANCISGEVLSVLGAQTTAA